MKEGIRWIPICWCTVIRTTTRAVPRRPPPGRRGSTSWVTLQSTSAIPSWMTVAPLVSQTPFFRWAATRSSTRPILKKPLNWHVDARLCEQGRGRGRQADPQPRPPASRPHILIERAGPAISDRLADSTASTAASSAACSAINITPARWLLSAAIAGCSDSWLQRPIPAAHIGPAGIAAPSAAGMPKPAGCSPATGAMVRAPPVQPCNSSSRLTGSRWRCGNDDAARDQMARGGTAPLALLTMWASGGAATVDP